MYTAGKVRFDLGINKWLFTYFFRIIFYRYNIRAFLYKIHLIFFSIAMTLLCKCHTCRRRCSSEKDLYKLLFAPSPRPHNGHFAYCCDRLYIRWKRYKTNRARSEINLEKVIKVFETNVYTHIVRHHNYWV